MIFKNTLNNEQLIEFILDVSADPDEIDIESLEEQFHNVSAVLVTVSIESLRFGDPNYHLEDSRKQKRYNKLNPEDAPPIIVDASDYSVIDGHHRIRSYIHRGITEIRAYLIYWD